MFRSSVGHNHLRQGQTIEDGPNDTIIVVSHCGEDYALSMMESCRTVPMQYQLHVIRSERGHKPMCIFHFCHSSSFPLTLKLTPSG